MPMLGPIAGVPLGGGPLFGGVSVMREIQTDYLTGKTVYFLLRNTVSQIWNGSAFEDYLTANFANYPIAGTEQGAASAYYTGDMPAVSPGVYYVVAKERIGGSPAESDISIGWGQVEWTGVAILPLAGVPISGSLSGQIVSVASGTTVLASGSIYRSTYASGVVGASGGFLQAWGTSGAGTVGQNLDKTSYTLSGTIGGKDWATAMDIVAAGVAGKVSGAGTGTERFASIDGATQRTTVVVDASGNRTNVTYP